MRGFFFAVFALLVGGTASAQNAQTNSTSIQTFCSTNSGVTWTPCNPSGGGGGSVTQGTVPWVTLWPSVTPTAASTYTVATGGTAVTAIAASTIAHGFVVRNPTTATEAGCFSITGTATITPGGGNACLNAGESYEYDGPVSTALSINAATSGHVFTIWYW